MSFQARQILCALDLGPASPTILRWARLLAEVFSSSVEILHVNRCNLPHYFMRSQCENLIREMRRCEDDARRNLSRLAEEHLGAGIDWSVTSKTGDAIEMIRAHIAKTSPDLVILGEYRCRSLRRLFRTSVPEALIRLSNRPLLLVASPEEEATSDTVQIRNVLCVSDSCSLFSRSLVIAATLARIFDATLIALVLNQAEREEPEEFQRLRSWLVDCYGERGHAAGVSVKQTRAEEILRVAEQMKADLLVTCEHPKRLIKTGILGPFSRKVIKRFPFSILFVPERRQSNTKPPSFDCQNVHRGHLKCVQMAI